MEVCNYLALVLAIIGAATAACAQDAIPDLKGTWFGKGKVIIFGGHAHHPGVPQDSPPAVRDIEMTLLVEGQNGRLAWGRSSSANADTKEPFTWAISSDNKSIIGSDTDGSFRIHPTRSRPDGEVLHPQRSQPEQIDCRGCYPMGEEVAAQEAASVGDPSDEGSTPYATPRRLG